MKKNLKKVISAVLALTLAMSSFVAMTTSAASFADVADTANYAEAVNALAAIGAISGYEDGTFLPDNNITRAEVTTMVVAALNMSADAQSSGATTKFADVNEKAKWAAGYVNVGVANGWISGMSATEFAPSDNVTYAQVLSMLTRILGYGDFAVSKGGWPDGYLAAAASAGILSGVSAAANDAMTRAQVAQLIWNAVQAPKLDITTFGVTASDSLMQKLDGKGGREFRTILSERFDAYIFNNVIVDATSKSSNLEAGTVDLRLTSTGDWNPETGAFVQLGGTTSAGAPIAADELDKTEVGNTAAEDYLFSSAKIIVSFIDDEWKLLYFKPTSKVSTTTVDGSLVNSVTATELQIKKSAVTTAVNKYTLSSAELYINGTKYCDVNAATAAEVKAVIENAVGDVVLYEDTTATGKAYNKVMVDIYALAKVNQVTVKNAETVVRLASQVWPTDAAIGSVDADADGNIDQNIPGPGNQFTVTDDDVANGDKVVTVTKAGVAADLASLAKGDIVAIKYDVQGTVDASKDIEILATSDTVTGAYTYYDDVEDLYEVGGAMYEAARTLSITRGTTYTFALDPFGRLFSSEEEASSKNYAIVEKYNDVSASGNSSEYDFVDVITLDGQSKRLYIDNTTAAMTNAAAAIQAIKGATPLNANGIENFTGTALSTRVIEYSVKTSTGRVNSMTQAATVAFGATTPEKYNSASNRLGKPLAATTTVLDATVYVDKGASATTADYKASSLSSLSESVGYAGFLVHPNSSNQYTYVVLTVAGAKYGASSDFAVAAADASTSSGAIVDDEDVYTLRVMKDGANDAEVLNISQSAMVHYYDVANTVYASGTYASLTSKVKKGAAFFYTVDSYGLVDRIDVIFEGGKTFDQYRDSAVVHTPDNVTPNVIVAGDWYVNVDDNGLTSTNELIQLFAAPVLLATDTSISFSKMDVDSNGQYVDTNVEYSYGLAADANIYYYDMSSSAATNYTAFSGGAFNGISIADADANGKAYIANVAGETNFDGALQVAFVMVVDGMITNALVIGE